MNDSEILSTSYDYKEETDINKLKEYAALLENDKAELIKINTKLSAEIYDRDNPERALLCISHEEERAYEAEQKLMTLYQACHENRVAISDVKNEAGEILEVLCLLVPAQESPDALSLLPIFEIRELGIGEVFEFPSEGGGWQSDQSDGVIEASLLAH